MRGWSRAHGRRMEAAGHGIRLAGSAWIEYRAAPSSASGNAKTRRIDSDCGNILGRDRDRRPPSQSRRLPRGARLPGGAGELAGAGVGQWRGDGAGKEAVMPWYWVLGLVSLAFCAGIVLGGWLAGGDDWAPRG